MSGAATGTDAQAAKDAPRSIEITAADGSRFAACLATPRTGHGPALLVLHDSGGLTDSVRQWCRRFADEGYAVLAPDLSRHFDRAAAGFAAAAALADIAAARTALAPHLEAGARTAAIGLGAGAALAWRLACHRAIEALALYDPVGLGDATDGPAPCPATVHVAGAAGRAALERLFGESPRARVYLYPDQAAGFADPTDARYDRHAANVAHSRTLGTIRSAIGPHYDLARLFEEHVRHEFVTHDPHATMATMVGSPYVNHVPTLAGGVGHDMLKRFYTYHFIPKLPDDRRSIMLSETVGPDTVVLELVTSFTHTVEIDYLLPGIPPSGKKLELPTVIVAKFRGDKLYHEHIYWDQASLLVQLGLLDPKGLPVAGRDEARKMLDQTRPANELMARWRDSDGKPI